MLKTPENVLSSPIILFNEGVVTFIDPPTYTPSGPLPTCAILVNASFALAPPVL